MGASLKAHLQCIKRMDLMQLFFVTLAQGCDYKIAWRVYQIYAVNFQWNIPLFCMFSEESCLKPCLNSPTPSPLCDIVVINHADIATNWNTKI